MSAFTIKRDFGYDSNHKVFKCVVAPATGRGDIVCTSQISFKDAYVKCMEAMGIAHKEISQADMQKPIDGTYTGDVHMSDLHTCAAGTTGTAWPGH